MEKGAFHRAIKHTIETPSSKNDGLPFFGEGAGDEDFIPP
jgi:hypothetical protein